MNQQNNKEINLTARQIEVLTLCVNYPDLSPQGLAEKLGVIPSTLRNILSTIYLRLGVTSRVAAIAEARKLGLISQPSNQDG